MYFGGSLNSEVCDSFESLMKFQVFKVFNQITRERIPFIGMTRLLIRKETFSRHGIDTVAPGVNFIGQNEVSYITFSYTQNCRHNEDSPKNKSLIQTMQSAEMSRTRVNIISTRNTRAYLSYFPFFFVYFPSLFYSAHFPLTVRFFARCPQRTSFVLNQITNWSRNREGLIIPTEYKVFLFP